MVPSYIISLTLGLAYPYFAYRRSKFVVDHFVRLFGSEVGRNIRGFTSAALEKLREHSWPGNVRELSNHVKQAMVMSMGKVVDIDVLSLCSDGVSETKYPTFKEAKAEFERSYVTRCLQNVRKRSKRFLLFDEEARNPTGRLSILITRSVGNLPHTAPNSPQAPPSLLFGSSTYAPRTGSCRDPRVPRRGCLTASRSFLRNPLIT